MVQPCSRRVIGTRFLVRFSVTSANSPDGCQSTPINKLAPTSTERSSTTACSASIRVASVSDAVRNGTKRESAWVTRSWPPSGESANDHGLRLALRFLIHSSATAS